MKKFSIFLALLLSAHNALAAPTLNERLMPLFTDGQANKLVAELFPLDGGSDVTVKIDGSTKRKFTFGASSDTAHTLTFGDGGTTAAQVLTISPGTADADDDGRVVVSAGGAAVTDRGGWLQVLGNEDSSAKDGSIQFYLGNDAEASLEFYTSTGSADVRRWFLTHNSGVLANDATNGGDLSFGKAGTTIAVQEGTAAAACSGTATANGTTAVTVSTTCATTGSRIFLSATGDGTGSAAADQGACWATNIVNGVSFDLDCPDNANNAAYNWIIFHEAA